MCLDSVKYDLGAGAPLVIVCVFQPEYFARSINQHCGWNWQCLRCTLADRARVGELIAQTERISDAKIMVRQHNGI